MKGRRSTQSLCSLSREGLQRGLEGDIAQKVGLFSDAANEGTLERGAFSHDQFCLILGHESQRVSG